MDAQTIRENARRLMDQHGLMHWSIAINQSHSSFGLCYYSGRLEFSEPLNAGRSDAEVINTILHEIAHAKAGHAAGHGRMWKLHAIAIGAKPERCGGHVDALLVPGVKRIYACTKCGFAQGFQRLVKRHYLCGNCYKRGERNRIVHCTAEQVLKIREEIGAKKNEVV